ncbi:MAG TPA: GspH/FimT family pseudopilin [Candidatus Acidoferrales bacterium]|nr:GspH/FimT family pseudopilin [Candidatus Acidoferrales bacterium]
MAKAQSQRRNGKAQKGFTTVELMVSLGVMVVIAAIAVPSLLQGWNSYRLTSAAGNIAGLLERARFEAIRRNTRIACIGAPQANGFAIWIDLNGNGALDPGEPEVIFNGAAVPMAAGTAPGPASMGAAYANAIVPPGPATQYGSVSFNARGTTVTAAGLTAPYYVVYLGMTNQPTYGYRAVTITPMGQVKTWFAQANGAWVAQ